ncbi:MAG: sugar phosphate isomerase/epimerase [Alphaproteobacteria bacterium]|nr:sugar phosphate isomerase/epimerase [Alphaproteobacteria bacterium]
MAYRIAYQLYSSRLFPPLAPQLPILKDMGYEAIEPWLPAYEDDPRGFRRDLDAAGLECWGFHMPLDGLIHETERFADIAETLGATYMIPPWIEPERRGDDAGFWRRLGESLAQGGERVAGRGLKVVWHNHDYEYIPLADGTRPIDHILDAAGPTVGFEADFAWVVRGGADPVTEIKRYAKRISIIQMKDTAPLGTKEDGGWAATGDGIVDWTTLAPLFATTAADHLVAEHDNPSDWQLFARRSIDYTRSLGL